MAVLDDKEDGSPSRAGYVGAIFVSAAGHAALFALIFFIAPHYLLPAYATPPSYTVKIVDKLPAGDLGTHLPRLARPKPAREEKPHPAQATPPKPAMLADNDKNAIALKGATAAATPTATPTAVPPPATATPALQPTPKATAKPTPAPTLKATPRPTPTPVPKAAVPKPSPKPKTHAMPKSTPAPKGGRKHRQAPPAAIAKAKPASSVKERLNALKRKMLAEHLKKQARENAEAETDEESSEESGQESTDNSEGGPAEASGVREGKGYGVGAGTGSMGILQDPDFLLYYQTVQDRIKKAWTFTSGANDLTATANFSIGADGSLITAKIGASSNNPAFDDSVIRAIRAAAPFPPPPKKFQSEFYGGIQAVFKLGELKS